MIRKKYEDYMDYEEFDEKSEDPIKDFDNTEERIIGLKNIIAAILGILVIIIIIGIFYWTAVGIGEIRKEISKNSSQNEEYEQEDEFLNLENVDEFNQEFEQYVGNDVYGVEIIELLKKVLLVNKDFVLESFDEHVALRVVLDIGPDYTNSGDFYYNFSGENYRLSVENIQEFISEIRTDREYIVQISEYNQEGYISEIRITDINTYNNEIE